MSVKLHLSCTVDSVVSKIPHIRMVYLVNMKFGELEGNANWWTFNLASRTMVSVDCLINFIIHLTRAVT